MELIILWVWRASILKSTTKESAKNNLDLLEIQVTWVKCGLETMDDYIRRKWSLFRDGYFHIGYDDNSATVQMVRVRRWLVVLVYRTFWDLCLDVRIILKWKLNRNWGWHLHSVVLNCGPMVKYCDHDNGHLSAAKFGVSWSTDSKSDSQKRLSSVEQISTHFEG